MHRLLPILLLLSLSACTDSDLQKVAKSLNAAALAVGTVQDSIISASDQNLITLDTARKLMETCVRANLAGKQAVAVTRSIQKLDPTSRGQLLQILKPIVDALQVSINSDIISIPDLSVRQKVQLGLTAVQTSINAAIVILAAGG